MTKNKLIIWTVVISTVLLWLTGCKTIILKPEFPTPPDNLMVAPPEPITLEQYKQLPEDAKPY